jgi:hypothetical protein
MKPKLLYEITLAAEDELIKAKKELQKWRDSKKSDLSQIMDRPTSFEEAEIASYIILKEKETL